MPVHENNQVNVSTVEMEKHSMQSSL